MARYRLHAILFALGLVVYGALAWDRIGKQSGAPQFAFQADAWLQGHVAIENSVEHPLVDADWAKVETVALDDGTEVRGRRMSTRPMFHELGGTEIPIARVRETRGLSWYVSFPPLPTLLMLPSAAISGRAGNDVIPTLLLAALILPLALLVLRRLAAAGLSKRSERDDLWLVATLAFGTVLFFASVQGTVWYTAQVVGVVLALVYVWASIEAKHPIVAGIALGAAALTRTPMAFMFPLFVLEAWRMAGGGDAWRATELIDPEAGVARADRQRALRWGDRKAMLRGLAPVLGRFVAPIIVFAILGMIYNYVRFGSPTEFGHTYLNVRQQTQIEQWGLANYHYLSRNLTVALTLLPEWIGHAPWIQISGHGLALWITTPLFLYVLWPRDKNPLHRSLWITTLLVALPSLLYMNSGWVQFGYRFSLDYTVFLILLIAIGGRPLGRVAKTLIVVGILINLFGAVTFDRSWQYYRTGGNTYDVIVAH